MKQKYIVFFISIIFLIGATITFVEFIDYHQDYVKTKGWVINDPLFDVFPLMDVSLPIFFFTYGPLVLFLFYYRKNWSKLSELAAAYGLLVLVRVPMLYFFPLTPPADQITLNDPFLNGVIYPGHITSDLFFSGHTGLIFILFYLSKNVIYVIFGLILGVLLIIQHVHYTVDILAAPAVAFFVVLIINKVMDNFSVDAKND